MGGARLTQAYPTVSDDDDDVGPHGGGAPLYGWSPVKSEPGTKDEQQVEDSSPEVSSPEASSSTQAASATATADTGDSVDNDAVPKVDRPGEKDPKTPSDQEIRTPEPFKPQRTFSKSTLRAATRALLSNAVTSIGIVPPALTLSAYPGPGARLQGQPSFPIVVPTSIPLGIPGPHVQGIASVAGSTTHNFISAVHAMNDDPEEDGLHPAQRVSKCFFFIVIFELISSRFHDG
jgi:hypothetical protein